jgi:hypothetical protein
MDVAEASSGLLLMVFRILTLYPAACAAPEKEAASVIAAAHAGENAEENLKLKLTMATSPPSLQLFYYRKWLHTSQARKACVQPHTFCSTCKFGVFSTAGDMVFDQGRLVIIYRRRRSRFIP